MKNFTDELVNLILKNEEDRLNNIMKEVTTNISKDFAKRVFKLLDEYYDNYTPIRYVRVYGKKRKMRTKSGRTNMMPRPGQVSLHAFITREDDDGAIIGSSGGSFAEGGWYGGVAFDESMLKEKNAIRHLGRESKDSDGNSYPRISEWNIVENFLFAGDGSTPYGSDLKGDWRGQIDYPHPSADEELIAYLHSYDAKLREHYDRAYKNFS